MPLSYYRFSGNTDQRLARARHERSAAGSLCRPDALTGCSAVGCDLQAYESLCREYDRGEKRPSSQRQAYTGRPPAAFRWLGQGILRLSHQSGLYGYRQAVYLKKRRGIIMESPNQQPANGEKGTGAKRAEAWLSGKSRARPAEVQHERYSTHNDDEGVFTRHRWVGVAFGTCEPPPNTSRQHRTVADSG